MSRTAQIRRNILEILHEIEPYALPESQLRLSLDGRMRPPVGQAEFEEAITWLNVNKHIAPLSDDLDPDAVKWVITETGKTLLLK